MVCLSSCRQDDKNSGHQEDNKNYDQQEDKNSLPNSNITFNVDSIKVHNALNYQALRTFIESTLKVILELGKLF